MKAHPIFFVGAERSGTTLFRLMIDSHPEVTCLEGFAFVADAIEPSPDTMGPSEDGGNGQWSMPSVDQYRQFVKTDTIFSTSGFSVDPSLGSFAEISQSFLEQRLEASGKSHVVAKLHEGFERMLAIWPDEVRFIHLLRDPRPAALSGVPMEWGGNAYVAAAKWIKTEQEWDRVSHMVSPDRCMEVRFEDLVTGHEEVLAKVCAFIGVGYTDQMLEYAAETDYELPDPSRAYAWKSEMSDRQVQLVEARVGDLLVDRGFQPSELAKISLAPRDLQKISAQVRLKKWRHKLLAHGLVGIGELVTRKLRLSFLHTPLKQKMNSHERAARKRSWREPGREYSLAPHKR